MADRGNANKHKYTYSNGIKAVEEQKWGRDCARSRYGALDYENRSPQKPKDQSTPQRLGDSSNLRDKGYDNEVPENSWLRGGGRVAKANLDTFLVIGVRNETRTRKDFSSVIIQASLYGTSRSVERNFARGGGLKDLGVVNDAYLTGKASPWSSAQKKGK